MSGFTFKQWYEVNRERLSEARKVRYRTDPEYKELVRARTKDYKDRVRKEKPSPVGLSTEDVCTALGISPWTLNKWKLRGLYPAPTKHVGRPRFTEDQLGLLELLREFFLQNPRKKAGTKKDQLAVIVQVIDHNWER